MHRTYLRARRQGNSNETPASYSRSDSGSRESHLDDARLAAGSGSNHGLTRICSSPAGCRWVPPGAALQDVLDRAPGGTTLCLDPGVYTGPIYVRHPVTLWGPRTAVIRSPGNGTTIEVKSNEVHLMGFTVRGSGNRFDRNDSAIRIHGANIIVEGVRIEKALFSLTAEESHNISFQRNEIS